MPQFFDAAFKIRLSMIALDGCRADDVAPMTKVAPERYD